MLLQCGHWRQGFDMDRSSDRQGLWLGEWRYALSGVVGGLLWLTLVVVLPLRSSIALACPSCGYSYAPVFCLKWPAPTAGSRYPQMSVPVGA